MGIKSFVRSHRDLVLALDPFGSPIKNEEMFDDTNLLLTVALACLFVLYAIVLSIQFANRPITEEFAQAKTDEFPPIPITLRMWCSDGDNCFKKENGTIVKYAEVRQKYNDVQCPGHNGNFYVNVTEDMFWEEQPGQFELCYSFLADDGVDVWVPELRTSTGWSCDYGEECSFFAVEITSPYSETMKIRVDMEMSQRKSVFLGLNAYEDHGELTYETYNADLFYDGKNGGTSAATLRIRSQQYSNHYSREKAGDVFTLLAAIGGAATMIRLVLKIAHPVIRLVYGKVFGVRWTAPPEDPELGVASSMKSNTANNYAVPTPPITNNAQAATETSKATSVSPASVAYPQIASPDWPNSSPASPSGSASRVVKRNPSTGPVVTKSTDI